MILGTHNTMTYLKPKQWYLRPIQFLAKCQSVDYKTQVEKYGVQSLDIRIFWNKDGILEYRHGLFHYDGSNFEELLEYCNEQHLYVRLLFELRTTTEKRNDIELLKAMFKSLCDILEEKYQHITFYGGRSSGDGEILHDFKNNVNIVGLYSSDTTLFPNIQSKFLKIIDDWCPWLYAKLKNRKNHQIYDEQYKDSNIVLMYDFINIK